MLLANREARLAMIESLERTQRLAGLCDSKLATLLLLRDLAVQQRDEASRADANMLLAMLARKQPLMDELNRIQSELNDFAGDDPELRQWSTPLARQNCRHVNDRSQDVLREIMALEDQTLRELGQRRDALAVQLQDGSVGMVARAAYLPTTSGSEGTLDLSSS